MIDWGHILLGDSTMGGLLPHFLFVFFRHFFLIFSAVLSKLRPFDYQRVSIMQMNDRNNVFIPFKEKNVDTRG